MHPSEICWVASKARPAPAGAARMLACPSCLARPPCALRNHCHRPSVRLLHPRALQTRLLDPTPTPGVPTPIQRLMPLLFGLIIDFQSLFSNLAPGVLLPRQELHQQVPAGKGDAAGRDHQR